VDGYVFSCEWFAPAWVPREHLAVIAPSIDPFSAKNESIAPAIVAPLLQYVGLLEGGGHEPVGTFTRRDGSRGHLTRRVDLVGTGRPPPDAPRVPQGSRWAAL